MGYQVYAYHKVLFFSIFITISPNTYHAHSKQIMPLIIGVLALTKPQLLARLGGYAMAGKHLWP